MSEPERLDYETPDPPPPMSRMCCFAITWAVLTSPAITFFPVAALIRRGGPVALFLARNQWLQYLIFMGLPLAGIFFAVKGVTDVRNSSDLDGEPLGIWAIWIGVISIVIGSRAVGLT